ncbi:MAG: hypothetical protein GKR88_14790 [Flavobacteriaceae bacterium]|nr:MAG: hypothetical protein GKR88_14790 [Flavobacteriaceae bacterium]
MYLDLIVKVIVDGNAYFLDATDKFLPFGLVPFKCLNGEARIMDFKNGSFWEKIYPAKRSFINTKVKFTLNENDELVGDLTIRKGGYDGLRQRKKRHEVKEEKILEGFESENVDLEVEAYKQIDFEKPDIPTEEVYSVLFEPDAVGAGTLRMNPFLIDRFTVNPFKLEERLYPVDYGYERKYTYAFSFEIPENYEIKRYLKVNL